MFVVSTVILIERDIFSEKCNLDIREMYGSTALQLAAKKGHKEVVDLLIAAGANLNLAATRSMTPIMGRHS